MSTDELLNGFDSVWLHSKINLFTGSSSLFSNNAAPSFSVSNDILEIRKQSVDNVLNPVIGQLKFVWIKTIIKSNIWSEECIGHLLNIYDKVFLQKQLTAKRIVRNIRIAQSKLVEFNV